MRWSEHGTGQAIPNPHAGPCASAPQDMKIWEFSRQTSGRSANPDRSTPRGEIIRALEPEPSEFRTRNRRNQSKLVNQGICSAENLRNNALSVFWPRKCWSMKKRAPFGASRRSRETLRPESRTRQAPAPGALPGKLAVTQGERSRRHWTTIPPYIIVITSQMSVNAAQD